MERAGDEGGGGCGLEEGDFVGPEEGETCLDGGAEGSGEPRSGWLVFRSFGGWDGMGWGLESSGYQDWSSISKRRSGGMGRGRVMAVDLEVLGEFIEVLAPYVLKYSVNSVMIHRIN